MDHVAFWYIFSARNPHISGLMQFKGQLYTLIIWPSNGNICPQRELHTNIHSNFIQNSPKLEKIQMSTQVNGWTHCGKSIQWNSTQQQNRIKYWYTQQYGWISKTFDEWKKPHTGLPWWRSSWESTFQCRGLGFEPWSGKIPHATEQLSPCATTTEPVLWSPQATTTEPACHNCWSPCT